MYTEVTCGLSREVPYPTSWYFKGSSGGADGGHGIESGTALAPVLLCGS